jgi:CheY-like chemotaxis protein
MAVKLCKMAQSGNYALILMDMQMPVMNGLDATRAIRRLPGMAEIPILAMTANAFDEGLQALLRGRHGRPYRQAFAADVLYATLLKWLSQPGAAAAPLPSGGTARAPAGVL